MEPAVIDTTKVKDRRELHFHTVADIKADVEMLARAGSVRALGNWSPGQILKHLAIGLNNSIDGFSSQLPWIVRTLMNLLMKRSVISRPMKAGFNLPAKAQTELIPPASTTWEEGLRCLRSALERQEAEPKRIGNSPFLGKMSPEDWNQLHCRHAELHLSFLIPQ